MIPSKENMELANLVGDWLKNEVAPVCGEYDEKNELWGFLGILRRFCKWRKIEN